MAKQRKTKKEKVRSRQRVNLLNQRESQGFAIKDEWLGTKTKKKIVSNPNLNKHFKTDLTKTLILTMLVLALELAIWSYLSRH